MYEKLKNKIIDIASYAEPNLVFIGLLGSTGFPLYYFIWSQFLPQPYENLMLRLIGAALFLPWVFYKVLPKNIRVYFPLYFFISSFLVMPYFFSFMTLKNEFSTVWAMSYMAGLFLLILLVYDWLLIALMSIVGFLLAYLTVFLLDGNVSFQYFQVEFLPIYLFAFVGGIICNYRNRMANVSKISFMHSLGGSIAHEMRNPLGSIINAMEAFRTFLPNKPDINSEATTYTLSRSGLLHLHHTIEESSDTVQRGNKIIDSILTSMRGEDIDTSDFIRVSAKEVVHVALENFGYKDPNDKNLIHVKSDVDFQLFGDKDLLIYVLFNLFKNSLHYKDKSGFRIDIITDTESEYNIITVKDNGPGIPKEKLSSIFDSFYSSGKKGGTGLGLHFCKRVIESFGGRIECESEPKRWTEFTISLPKYESAYVQKLQKDTLKEKHILVVDDQQSNRTITKQYLATLHCKIDEAENGQEAIELMSNTRYDLVFMDIEMPILQGDVAVDRIRTGRNVSRRVSSEYRDVPIIALSALPKKMAKTKALKAGMNEFLEKPLRKGNIISLFDKYFFSEKMPAFQQREGVLKDKNILLVDDSQTSRTFMAVILEHAGCHVFQANNGKEAIDALDKGDFDLILMDMEMPVMGGIEATQVIRSGHNFKRFKDFGVIPIIALTGNTDSANIQKVKDNGMNDHLGKPVTKEELIAVMAAWLSDEKPYDAIEIADDNNDETSSLDAIQKAKVLHISVVNSLQDMGGNELIHELFEIFLSDVKNSVHQLLSAHEKKDIKTVDQITHTIKGSAGNIGAYKMQIAAQWVNNHVRQGSWPDDEEWPNVFQHIYIETKTYLENYLTENRRNGNH